MAYNKSDLVSKIAQKSNLTKAQAEAAVNAFQDVFVEAMQSGEGLRYTHIYLMKTSKRPWSRIHCLKKLKRKRSKQKAM